MSGQFCNRSTRRIRAQEHPCGRALVGTLAVALLAFLSATAGASADSLAFKADLTGRGEVPPNESTGKGHCYATLDTKTLLLSWTCTYQGLTGGAPTGAHFHGPVSYSGLTSEENAPIQVGTPGSLTNPFKGTSQLDATQAHDLKIGRWYFNLHTPKFPAGELRGPVVHL